MHHGAEGVNPAGGAWLVIPQFTVCLSVVVQNLLKAIDLYTEHISNARLRWGSWPLGSPGHGSTRKTSNGVLAKNQTG